jgi:hypothetical protein
MTSSMARATPSSSFDVLTQVAAYAAAHNADVAT